MADREKGGVRRVERITEGKGARRRTGFISQCQSMPEQTPLPHSMLQYLALGKMDWCETSGGVWMI